MQTFQYAIEFDVVGGFAIFPFKNEEDEKDFVSSSPFIPFSSRLSSKQVCLIYVTFILPLYYKVCHGFILTKRDDY